MSKATLITAEDEQRILVMYANGMRICDITGEMRVRGSRIGKILDKYGVEKRQKGGYHQQIVTEEQVEEIRRLYKKGARPKEIAEQVGLYISTVKSWMCKIQRAEEASKPPELTSDKAGSICALFNAGMPIEEIARDYHVRLPVEMVRAFIEKRMRR